MKYEYRFKLEQQILNCWNVVEDIRVVYTAHQDLRQMSVDEISNVLMGLEHMYQLKFEALFDTFEKHLQALAEKES